MSLKTYHFPVQVYYEDTDHSGVVYHANYMKYFERAREDVIGIQPLIDLWEKQGIGFAVYKMDISFFDGAKFGEQLDIRSTVELDGEYRLLWNQQAWRPGADKAAVKAMIELVCLGPNKQVVAIKDVTDMFS